MEPQNQNKNEEKVTLESLYALLQKGERDAQKRSEEFDRKLEKSREEFDRDLKKSREEFDRDSKKRSEEFDRDLKKSREEFDRKFDKMVIEIGGIGNSNGDVAEEYFINAFEKNPILNGETYNKIIHNARLVSGETLKDDEYDIFLSNGKSAAIIEIKYNLKRGVIKRLLEKGENFRKFFPEYKNHKLYLGIAALSFRKADEENITKKGIAVIKQVGGKMVINSDNLKEF
ncbi:MAG: hypothetical protein FWG49_06280 [Leptospirales bacterium]|nr:hypothetical protein [Leptospirales bacterium]